MIFESRYEHGGSYDGQYNGVFGQTFDENFEQKTEIFQINTKYIRDQEKISASVNEDGKILVSWQSNDQDASNRWDINAQIIDSHGAKYGNEIAVRNSPDSDVWSTTTDMVMVHLLSRGLVLV